MEDNGHRQRLKKRFLANGRSALADHELLEMILHFAIPRKDTKELAKSLLKEFGSINKLIASPTHDLLNIDGLGESSVALLKSYYEFNLHNHEKALEKKTQISGPKDLIPYLQALVRDLAKEVFGVVLLNPQNHVLEHKIIHEGTVDQAVVYVREIVEFSLLKKASRVIAVHNHPSGNKNPSGADHLITQKLKDALKLMEIDLLDHIIIAGNDWYSFQENNQL